MKITVLERSQCRLNWDGAFSLATGEENMERIVGTERTAETYFETGHHLIVPLPYSDTGKNDRFLYAMALFYSSEGLIAYSDLIESKHVGFDIFSTIKNTISMQRYIIHVDIGVVYSKKDPGRLVETPVYMLKDTGCMLYDDKTRNELGTWILEGLMLEKDSVVEAVKSYANEYKIPSFGFVGNR